MRDAKPRRVYASMARSATQTISPPLLAQAIIEYESTQATLIFDGFTRFDHLDRTLVVGSNGAIRSVGPSNRAPARRADDGRRHRPAAAQGRWFPDGFHGTMAELLSAIAENREPIAQRPQQSGEPGAVLRGRRQRGARRTGEAGQRAAIACSSRMHSEASYGIGTTMTANSLSLIS